MIKPESDSVIDILSFFLEITLLIICIILIFKLLHLYLNYVNHKLIALFCICKYKFMIGGSHLHITGCSFLFYFCKYYYLYVNS